MSTGTESHWHEANQRFLMAALGPIRDALARHTAGDREETPVADHVPESVHRPIDEAAAALPSPAALQILAGRFGLSDFERDVLLLCAGVELDAGVAAACAHAGVSGGSPHPTFALAMRTLAEPHWSALTLASPLRRWRLLGIEDGDTLATSPLRIDERVLHFLAGVAFDDPRLAGVLHKVADAPGLPASHQDHRDETIRVWRRVEQGSGDTVVELAGARSSGRRAIAAAAAGALGLGLRSLHWSDIPTAAHDRDNLARMIERESVLADLALLVDCDDLEGAAGRRMVRRLVDDLQGLIVAVTDEPLATGRRVPVRIEVRKPTTAEQHESWRAALGPAVERLGDELDQVVGQFRLGVREIEAAGAGYLAGADHDDGADSAGALWQHCRRQARPAMEQLAQRIEPAVGWHDLVLPEPQKNILRDIAIHVRRRVKVYEEWGFAAQGERGLGISALFAGASGTGKTMAAEVLANSLELDLYRIDLSQVVSKYIGETEKNLRRVFDAADSGGAILLFDEADALFGKRSEVKDSHDRYANIEIGYLLQRMETYRGLAVLTTNMKSALDTAFMRRIRFVVQFPFPDAGQRAEIWRRVYPAETPTGELALETLARLNITGGSIRNIALNAAFLAAEAGERVSMNHLQRAARSEYAKLDKPATDSELGGW